MKEIRLDKFESLIIRLNGEDQFTWGMINQDKHFTKAEIERTRQTLRAGLKEAGRGPSSMAPAPVAPPLGGSAPGPPPSSNGRRGPRIARDNY